MIMDTTCEISSPFLSSFYLLIFLGLSTIPTKKIIGYVFSKQYIAFAALFPFPVLIPDLSCILACWQGVYFHSFFVSFFSGFVLESMMGSIHMYLSLNH